MSIFLSSLQAMLDPEGQAAKTSEALDAVKAASKSSDAIKSMASVEEARKVAADKASISEARKRARAAQAKASPPIKDDRSDMRYIVLRHGYREDLRKPEEYLPPMPIKNEMRLRAYYQKIRKSLGPAHAELKHIMSSFRAWLYMAEHNSRNCQHASYYNLHNWAYNSSRTYWDKGTVYNTQHLLQAITSHAAMLNVYQQPVEFYKAEGNPRRYLRYMLEMTTLIMQEDRKRVAILRQRAAKPAAKRAEGSLVIG
jgi:hypothetical protein